MRPLILISSAFFVATSVAGCAQKMIQKKIFVYGGASTRRTDLEYSHRSYIKARCVAISTSKKDFENMLANDVKVITEDRWYTNTTYQDENNKTRESQCYGSSYIVEGSESVLKDLK